MIARMATKKAASEERVMSAPQSGPIVVTV